MPKVLEFGFFRGYNQNMKIVISNTSHGAYRGVVDEIKRHLGAGDETIVIAPDRFTAFVERGLISTLELESTFGIEVMSFTRLATKLVGRDIKKCLTPEGSVMLISKAILDVKDSLSYYKNVAGADGFAGELYAALTALRNSGMTAEGLKEKAESIKDNISLKLKLSDMALIYGEYLKQLDEGHSDSSTRLMALASFLAEHPEAVANKRFVCTDIYEFSSPELEILRQIDKSALSLTVGLTSGYDNKNKRIYPDRAIVKLKTICDGKAEIVRNDEVLTPPIDAISKWLFSYSLPSNRVEDKDENGQQKVVVRVAKDRYDEILRLALDITRHVRKGGRYKDIEVFVSDIKSYQADVKAIFARYNIPFFIDEKEYLSEQTKVRYLLSALQVVRSGFRAGEVLNFVKNPLFYKQLENGEEEEVFLFENYVLKHAVDFGRFLSPFEQTERDKKFIAKNHKQQFTFEELDDKVRVLLESEEHVVPEKVRGALVNTLSSISFKGSVPVKNIVDGVKTLLEKVNEIWRSHVADLANISKFYEKCAEQVDEKIDAVLDEIDDVLGGNRTMSEFETIFKSMIKTLKIALVPTYLDCVFVGSYDSRFMGGMDVYILGAVSGKLPALQSGGIILNAKDEEALEQIGVEVSPTSYQKIMTGMYAVCDLMKKPHGKLVVSYPETSDGVFSKPSVVISELMGMLSFDGKPIQAERIDFEHTNLDFVDENGRFDVDARDEFVVDMFSTERGAYHEILRNAVPTISPNANSNRVQPEELDVYATAIDTLDEEKKEKLLAIDERPERISSTAQKEDTTSVSRLEKFYACPYQYYFAYTLALNKRQEGEFLGTENGTILHSVLEQLFTDVRDGRVDETNIEEKAQTYFDNAIKENEYEYLLEKNATKRALLRVKDESVSLAKDMLALSKHSGFSPYLLEAKIGAGDIKPMSINVAGKEIAFKGYIDRIDVKDDDFLIIDYKTFSAKLALKDIYYGQKIQLYIYMKAVKDSLGKRPVGVFYFPIKNSFIKDDVKKYEYAGQFANEEEVLKAIDDRYGEQTSKCVLPISGKTLNKNVFVSSKTIDDIGEYALAVAAKGEEAIENGFIRPFPMKDKCKNCDFSDVCAYRNTSERGQRDVKLSSFIIDDESVGGADNEQ